MTVTLQMDGLAIRAHESISEIAPAVWNALTGADQPYVSHAHFRALEQSGLVSPDTGFRPRYLLASTPDGQPVAAAPAFLKTSSTGELGVDLGLPLAHQRSGGDYFPKLQVEVPFTPTSGPRLMVDGAARPEEARRTLLRALDAIAARDGASSVQVGYHSTADQQALTDHGYLATDTTTFVCRADGHSSFESWVASMHGKGRRRVREEFDTIKASGVTFRTIRAADWPDDVAASIFRSYTTTYALHNTDTWLNRRYFEEVFTTMPDDIELHSAYDGNTWVGGFLCYVSSRTLYVQHWLQDVPRRDLFFALMYRTISDAINRGLTSMDFGPLGAHKPYRGAGPNAVCHAMLFRDPDFHILATSVLAKRSAAHQLLRADMARRLPFSSPPLPVEAHP